MKKLLIFLLFSFITFSQELFNSQSIYDADGGLYGYSINVNFYDWL